MNLFYLLVKTDLLSIRNFLRENKSRKLIALTLFIIIGLFALILYYVFILFFKNLVSYTDIGDVISKLVLAYSFLLVFLIMIPSYLFSSIASFYFNKSLSFLLISNRKYSEIYDTLVLKSFIMGIWPLFLIALPILFAYSEVFHLPPTYLVIILLLFIPFSLIAYSLVIFIIHVLTRFKLINNIYFWIFAIGGFLISLPNIIDYILPASLKSFYYADTIEEISARSIGLPVFNEFLPSTWMVNIISSTEVLTSSLLLVSWSAILVYISISLSKHKFIENWQSSQENNTPHSNDYLLALTKFNKKRSLNLAFIYRNFTMISRDTGSLAKSIFLFILSTVSIILLNELLGFRSYEPNYIRFLTILSFISLNFIITIFLLQYIFPIISQNTRDHILITAPISAKKLTSNFVNYSIFISVILGLVFSTPLILNGYIDMSYKVLITLATVCTSILIAMICLIIGTFLVNKRSGESEDLSSSVEGITTTLISTLMIGIITVILNKAIATYTQVGYFNTLVLAIFLVIPILTLIFIYMARDIIPHLLKAKLSV